jgi:DNA-binding transcriptional regulator/RsmH inhibitor MraZ
VTIDKAGRILIPAIFRERAGIVRETAVLGVSDKMEIWAPAVLAESDAASFERLSEALAAEAQGALSAHAARAAEPGQRLPRW